MPIFVLPAGQSSAEAKTKERRMQDGTAAGMITGRELMVEMQKKREVSHTLVCFDAVSLL